MERKFKKGDFVQVRFGSRNSWVGVVDEYTTKDENEFVLVCHLDGKPVGGYYEKNLLLYHPPVKISYHYLAVPSTGD